MAAPKKRTGTQSPRTVPDGPAGGPKKAKGVKSGSPNAGSKGNKDKGGKKKKGGKVNFNYDMQPLNPDFDPRMRRIGSPLNGSVKRGWIQTIDNLRVNFLFNPSQLDISHQTVETVRTPDQVETDDVLGVSYGSMGSAMSVKLLYDRTYELFSAQAGGNGKGFAHRFGVWADVAAWYVLLGMLPTMPTAWDDSLIVYPPQPKICYLFIGPKMVYYGRMVGINVAYSHWSQNMVPSRCAVDFSFEILPFTDDNAPLRGQVAGGDNSGGWRDDWVRPNVPDYLP